MLRFAAPTDTGVRQPGDESADKTGLLLSLERKSRQKELLLCFEAPADTGVPCPGDGNADKTRYIRRPPP